MKIIQDIAIVNSATPTVDVDVPIDLFTLSGTPTLTTSWGVTTTGTPINGMEFVFRNNATVTLGGNHVSIFGKQIPDELVSKQYTARLIRMGGAWEMFLQVDFEQSSIIAYTKLNLANSIVNADIATGAAIVYSKLVLTGSIVAADIATGAAIPYSKLSLSNSIVNADIATGAAIVYSKLVLTGSIVAADIHASAAIPYSKLSLSSSIVNADIAGGAAIAYSKLALTGAITNNDLAGGITLNKLAVSASPLVVIVTDGTGALAASTISTTKLGYLNDVTSDIQSQIDDVDAKVVPEIIIYTVGTYTPTAYYRIILADPTGGDVIINLPHASVIGKISYIIHCLSSSNQVTINAYSGDAITIDGSETTVKTLTTIGQSTMIVCDGVDIWYEVLTK